MEHSEYDVVVIGSGLGGLAAATNLSKKGVKTLIIESKDRVGGRFCQRRYCYR